MKTEKETRKDIIDKKLSQAGWKVNDRTQVLEEFEIEVGPRNETREPSSPYHNLQFSDYVLLGKDAKPLAVVEAKKPAKMPHWAANRPNSIASTYRSKRAVSFLSVSIPMALKLTFGTWITPPAQSDWLSHT